MISPDTKSFATFIPVPDGAEAQSISNSDADYDPGIREPQSDFYLENLDLPPQDLYVDSSFEGY